jgi:hypothetical protein
MTAANRPHRNLHRHLLLSGYRVENVRLWPILLARMKARPAQTYRFVREGNLDAWIDAAAGGTPSGR